MALGPVAGFEEDDGRPIVVRSANGKPGKVNGHGVRPATSAAQAGSDDEPWPEPLDIFAEHLSVPAAIDETCLPATLLRFARAEAGRLGVDPVGIAGLAVGACSAVISDNWSVRLKHNDDWTQQSRIWVALVDHSGSNKTEQIKCVKRPLDRIEAEFRAEYQKAQATHMEEMEHWESLPKKQRESTPKPRAPVERRLTTQDTTIEAISETLKNEGKLAIVIDELVSFLFSFDRYSQTKGSSGRAHALSLFEGGVHRVDRIGRGSLVIGNWSAVVLGAIQPERLRGIMADLAEDGLLQRLMTIMPARIMPANPDDDDRAPDKAARDAYETLIRGLLALHPPDRAGKPGTFLQVWAEPAVTAARRRVFRLVERIERDRGLPRPLVQTVSKWRGLLARLALTFHLIGLAEGAHDEAVTLKAETVEMAARFIFRVIAPSTFRFYREVGADGDPHARWIAGFILSRGLTHTSARDIGKAYRELRGNTPAIAKSMSLLEHAGWVRGDHHPKIPKWLVHPELHRVFSERAAVEREQRARERELISNKIIDLVR